MTPAEFRELYKERVKWYERKRGDNDAIGAYQCYVSAACAGNKDLSIRDFLIFREKEPEKPRTAKSMNATLDNWVAAGGKTI